jgi:hypothetical protein
MGTHSKRTRLRLVALTLGKKRVSSGLGVMTTTGPYFMGMGNLVRHARSGSCWAYQE